MDNLAVLHIPETQSHYKGYEKTIIIFLTIITQNLLGPRRYKQRGIYRKFITFFQNSQSKRPSSVDKPRTI